MKKIICLFMTIVMSLGMVACTVADKTSSKNEYESKTDGTGVTSHTSTENTTTKESEVDEKFEKKMYIPEEKVAINFNRNLGDDVGSNSLVFYDRVTDDVIVLNYDNETDFNGTIEDIFNFLNDGDLFVDICTRTTANFRGNDNIFKIEVIDSEPKKVAGLDSICYTGMVIDRDGEECWVYGYTFLIDDIPCMLVCVLTEESQTEENKTKMIEEVDGMMATVRIE